MTAKLDTNTLMVEINKFRYMLENGESFWAPYLVNFNSSSDPKVRRGLGKASPEEIKKSVEYIVSLFPNVSGDEVRQKLVDGSLPDDSYNYKGVDCSGFTYYIMDGIYQKVLGKELMDELSIPKDNVLNGAYNFDDWKKEYRLSDAEAKALPEDVPIRWVVEKFKRKPVNLCRVAGLLSDYSSFMVPVSSMRVGDLVDLVSREGYGPHVAIICDVKDASVSLAHSGRKDSSEIGGVLIEEVPFDKQSIHTNNLRVPRDFREVRRLKALK